jgi:uncharacterized C2H2 Zn-finger protein
MSTVFDSLGYCQECDQFTMAGFRHDHYNVNMDVIVFSTALSPSSPRFSFLFSVDADDAIVIDVEETAELLGCSACAFTTTSQHGLDVHRQVSKHGCFRCKYCQWTFSRLEDANKHINVDHGLFTSMVLTEQDRLFDASVHTSGRPRLFHSKPKR